MSFEGFKGKVLYLSFKNTRKVLALSAYKFFNKVPSNIIGNRTNGKSSVADYYLQILKLLYVKVASIGTLGIKFNNTKTLVENTTLDPIELAKNLTLIKRKKLITLL